MDSFIFLARLCPSIPIIWKILVSGMASLVAVVMNSRGGPSGALCIFHQRSRGFPLCTHHHNLGPTLVPVDGTTLVDHWVFVLGGDQKVFDGSATFEVSLDAISTTDLFDTFTKTLCVGYDKVPLVLHSMVSRLGIIVAPIIDVPGRPVDFFSTLSKAHLGYLQLVRAFLRCSFSCWSNSGLLHTVEALWERVWMTLNLAERWWWLSHCRYWSVCVGFLYTVMDREPSTSGLTIVSKKGMEPSSLLSSTVNLMAGSTLFMCCRKPCLLTSLWMTKVSSTYLCQNLGVGAV